MKKAMWNRQRKLWVRGGILLTWMAVIFSFSSIPGTGMQYEVSMWYVLERKSAHVFEFALLTFFAFRFFRVWFVTDESWRSVALLSGAFAFLWGVMDELHQSFVFGRGSHLSDVGIDLMGAVIALSVIASTLLYRCPRNFQKMIQ